MNPGSGGIIAKDILRTVTVLAQRFKKIHGVL